MQTTICGSKIDSNMIGLVVFENRDFLQCVEFFLFNDC